VCIFRLSHIVRPVGFVRFTEICIWGELFFICITCYAFSSIPVTFIVVILNSKCSLGHDFLCQSLAEILYLTELIISDAFLILNSFLHNDGLWESTFNSLRADRFSCSVKQSLLPVAKLICLGVDLPLVISLSLLSRSIVTMSFDVLLIVQRLLFLVSTLGVYEVLGWIRELCSKPKVPIGINLALRPLVLSAVSL